MRMGNSSGNRFPVLASDICLPQKRPPTREKRGRLRILENEGGLYHEMCSQDRWFMYLDNTPARVWKCKVNVRLQHKDRAWRAFQGLWRDLQALRPAPSTKPMMAAAATKAFLRVLWPGACSSPGWAWRRRSAIRSRAARRHSCARNSAVRRSSWALPFGVVRRSLSGFVDFQGSPWLNLCLASRSSATMVPAAVPTRRARCSRSLLALLMAILLMEIGRR